VQGALTNVRKHAGRATARITIRYDPDALAVEVVDDGRGAAAGDAGGHGLTGMRERVAVFGGTLTAGPGRDGGFTLRARFPVAPTGP
jgi:signal transduction histidine kinase